MQPATTPAILAGRLFDRGRLERIADGLAVALAVSLPWSTSATGILTALWFIAVLPTLNWARLREIAWTPAGGLPIAFALLALIGVLWSHVTWTERLTSVVPFARMLAIPLLMCQFSRSPRGIWVVYSLIASCTVLLIASYWYYLGGSSGWYPFTSKQFGVPVKDYISQSAFFSVCTFALLELAIVQWSARRQQLAVGLLVLALLFLANIALVATGRTAILIVAVLLVAFAVRRADWKISAAVLAAGAVLAGIAWMSSSYLRERASSVIVEIHDYEARGAATSSGLRLDYWRQALQLMAQAPLIGHGTGSMNETFKKAPQAFQTDNPHNQTFTVGIQLGLIGVALLYAMWLSHFLLFLGREWVAWFGLVVVIHVVIGSLVNSYLFDFTSGWAYAVGVGVAGGMMLRRSVDGVATVSSSSPAIAKPRTAG